MKSRLRFSYLLLPALVFSYSSPSLAQLVNTQVITFTVGNTGSVTTERSFTTTEESMNTGFTLITDEERVSDRTVTNEGDTQIIQTDNFQINTGSFASSTETKTEVTTVQVFDTFDFIDSTSNQSFSVSF